MTTTGGGMELGIYSFGNTPRTASGGYGTTAQAIRDAIEAARVAESVGLDFFGFGEHHTRAMPISSPTSMLNAAAAVTQRIKLGTTVTVLSTEEPIRVFQQAATAAAVAPGRIELVAGRGSSPVTFPLFDFEESDYDRLFSSKLDLMMTLNHEERITWKGYPRRRPLTDALIVPQPERPLKLWLGSGGSPESVERAVKLGLPLFLGILGGSPEQWTQYCNAYRHAWAETHPALGVADIAIGVHGFVGANNREAKASYLSFESQAFQAGAAESGRPKRVIPGRQRDLESGGMVFAGDPNELTERILQLHEVLGHSRQVFQMDLGGMPQATYLKGIELLGTKVLPEIRKALNS